MAKFNKAKNLLSKNTTNKSEKIFDKNLFSIINFYFTLFKKNIFFWLLSSLFLISQPLTMIILFSLNFDIINYSFIFNIAPLVVGLIWLLFLINKLFLENKLNGIDVIMLSKPISKYETFWSRMIIIFSFLFLIMFSQFVFTSILVLSFSYEAKWITYLLINNLVITPFVSLGTSSILILAAIALKPLWFGIVSFLIIFFIGVAPIASRLTQNSDFDSTLVYDNNNYNSFSKLSIINAQENKTFLVNQINPESQLNIDKNIVGTLNNVPFYDYLIPGELMISMSSSLMNDLDFSKNQINGNYSLLKNKFIDTQLANLNLENSVFVSIRPNDISPFELNSIQYEELLLNNIKKIVNSSNKFVNLKDEKVVNFLQDKLENSLNWSTASLSNDEFMTVRALLGIDLEFSQLFYYFNNKTLLEQKTPNLLKQIELEINPSLSKLLSFLWNNNSTQMNIFDLKSFDDVSKIFPDARIKSTTEAPNVNDVNFIKNDLIRFSGSTIHYLDINKQYVQTTLVDMQKIDASIIDKLTWNNFVDNSSVTLENIVQLSMLLNSNLNNIYQVSFRANSEALFKYSHFMQVTPTTYLDNIHFPIMTIIFMVIGTNVLALYMFKNKNYKN
ncbi:MAG: hypothetical protein KFW07_03575 [Mycoplasmataceae bacterium]|nr:hypothetical protein [Mycoplasmataceae bacterium]